MSQTIGDFQLIRKVAESQSAEIFLAKRMSAWGQGGDYALKALRPHFARDRIHRGYLRTEYRVCKNLDHPNLVRMHELHLDDPRPHLVMGFIPGRSLQMVLRRQQPDLRSALLWLSQAADGLAHFHELGWVHLDIKPQNMVVSEDGHVTVVDFALAQRQETSVLRYLVRRLGKRRRPGTWSYMSPEQIQGGRLTGQADVYSLGATLYECLAGRAPFVGRRPQEILDQHIWANIPTVRSVVPDIPLQVDEFTQTMMAKDPLDRPQGMGYVSAMLRALAEAYGKAS